MIGNRRGQSTLEYALIIAVVVAAIIAMQFYLNRGVQGKLREAVDDISGGGNYRAGHTTSTVETKQTGNYVTVDEFGTGGLGQGVSQYKIIQAPTSMEVRTTNAEIIANLAGETLFE